MSVSPPPPAQGWAGRLLQTRWLVRAPIALFRAGLGPILGRHLVMLGHVGRSSGLERYVVLEVVGVSDQGHPYVVSGFGERAQWCRNVRAEPHVQLWWGTRRARPAIARAVDGDHSRRIIAAYAAAHPRAWHELSGVMVDDSHGPATPDQFSLPMFELVRI